MAIDVSELMFDPDLMHPNPIGCYRQTRTTSSGGMSQITQSPFWIYATVVPANGRQLQRLPEGDRVAAGMAFYTATELIASSPGYAGDIIYWKNQPYLVQYVDDYSENGMWAAVCTLTQVQGPAPGTPPG
jgi:hypothetical protein